jgi:signal peptide peptidase SppA
MKRSALLHITGLIFDSPLAIIPEKLESILHAIGPRLDIDQAALTDFLESRPPSDQLSSYVDKSPAGAKSLSEERPYQILDPGVAVIPVSGTLMKKGGWMTALSGCASYESIRASIECALDDPDVRGIMLDMESPGGTTHGCFELSDFIHGIRGKKPIHAISNDLCASAAYAVASAADHIYVTRTGAVGSIGVFALHIDQTAADEKVGLKFTYVFAGNKKVDGNPHEPLSRSARKDIQAEVDREYEMFVKTVARNRGADPDKVAETEAGVEFGENAVGLLADSVASFGEAISSLSARVSGDITVSLPSSPSTSLRGKEPDGNLSSKSPGDLQFIEMPAIPPHKTGVSKKAWDGPANKKRLKEGGSASYYRKAYAFAKSGGNPETKAGYSFIHHDISGDGSVGDANLKGCTSGIGILNGGRTGTVLTGSDRSGTYRHLAAHVRDGGQEPTPLKSYREYLQGVMAYANALEDKGLLVIAKNALLQEEGKMALMAKGKKEETMKKAKKAKGMPSDHPEDCEGCEYCEGSKEEAEAEASLDPAELEADADFSAASRNEKDDEEDEEDDPDEKEPDDDEDDEEEPEPKKKKGRRATVTALPTSGTSMTEDILNLCAVAGVSSKRALNFVSRGLSVKQVSKILIDQRAAKSSSPGTLSASLGGDGTGSKGSAMDRIMERVRGIIVQSGGTMQQSKALQTVLREEPDLYEAYEEERRLLAQNATRKEVVAYVMRHSSHARALKLGTEFGQPPSR